MTDVELLITAPERQAGESALSPEQLHIDKVVITAALTALFRKPALIRKMRPVTGRPLSRLSRDRGMRSL